MGVVKPFLKLFSADIFLCQIDQHQMIIRPAGYDLNAAFLQTLTECFCVLDDLLLILLELRLKRLFEADSLRRDHVHERPALYPGEYGLIKIKLLIDFIA